MSEKNRGILDTVRSSEQSSALRNFNPAGLVLKHLEKLNDREAEVITARYGLIDGEASTLEKIGKRLNLTRERIRQIEKDALKKLKDTPLHEELERGVDLIFQIIETHGNVIKERELVALLLPNASNTQTQAILFILHFVPRFEMLKESAELYQGWHVSGFDISQLKQVIVLAQQITEEKKVPMESAALFRQIRERSEETSTLSDDALESMLLLSKSLARNPFGEWGMRSWNDIQPKDVGDKAYLVLKHGGKPEHYSKITELINKQGFDSRTAHKETVHNELIKDKRFILVGRGIYALAEWGYKPGVVADVIDEILRKAGRPLSRDEIIKEVLRQRMVKTNTIIVGLSNRKRFIKTSDNKYTNV